jgi:signal transduction histidine kinase
MSLNEFLVLLTQITVMLLGVFTVADYLRERSRPRLDIALLFGSLAVIVALQWLGSALNGQPPWMGKIGSLLLVAQPYLLLRLVNQRRPVPILLQRLALAGMILSWLIVLFAPAPTPLPLTILIISYMVFFEVYAAAVLWKGASSTRGVSHWRLLLAASGSFLLALFLILIGLAAILPQYGDILGPLNQAFALASMLAYYLGFATPIWLRRAWQLSELYSFVSTGPMQWAGETVQQKLQRLTIAAERAVGGMAAGVALWDEQRGELTLTAVSKPSEQGKFPSMTSPALQRAWKERTPVLLSTSLGNFPEREAAGPADQRASLLVAPIANQEKAWGLLLVYLERVPLFASEDLSLLSLFNGQTAIALSYDRLLSEQAMLIEQLRGYNQRLEAMNEIDRTILSANSTEKIASQALGRLRELVPCQRASVAVFDLENRQGRLIATDSNGFNSPQEGSVLSMDHFPPFNALSPGREVSYIENILTADWVPPIIERLREQGLRSIIYTPLVAEERLIGAIALSSVEIGAFQPHHLDTLREVADQLAVGIQQSRLREELQRYNAELEQRVAERTNEIQKTVHDLQEEIAARQQATEALRIAQERLKQRAAELNYANKELEAFTYSVSHDLRAPLRAIDGFSRILLDKYSAHLDEEGQRYLRMVGANTRQMGELIDDLLSFSRLNRQAMSLEEVELTSLARLALRELERKQDGREVEIILRDLPACRADPVLMKQVFVNLLSNALKFTGKLEKARIEIGCERRENEAVFFVRDNGVGFDMRYAGKLFGVFQRLHRAEDFEGTGVGLAIVQRIIHRHGGRVWAEAEVDRGATFYFTLPEQAQGERIE